MGNPTAAHNLSRPAVCCRRPVLQIVGNGQRFSCVSCGTVQSTGVTMSFTIVRG